LGVRVPLLPPFPNLKIPRMKNPFTSIRVRWHETIAELRKSSWPDRKELLESTLVVMVGIVILGVFVFLSDFSLNQWVELLTRLVQ
jgi:preprotein translocase SecE subunit